MNEETNLPATDDTTPSGSVTPIKEAPTSDVPIVAAEGAPGEPVLVDGKMVVAVGDGKSALMTVEEHARFVQTGELPSDATADAPEATAAAPAADVETSPTTEPPAGDSVAGAIESVIDHLDTFAPAIEGTNHALSKRTRSEERRQGRQAGLRRRPDHRLRRAAQRDVPGNDYCNGSIAPITNDTGACMCDCLHVDDVAAMLKEKGAR
jgi:septal ring-binding cell division protein DamX